jgi:ABC-type lipoprotein export system ATPase subunit
MALQLHVKDLTKCYSREGSLCVVLDHITATFSQDSTYAIMGASGAGKSTFIKLLAGIEMPSSGNIHLFQKGFEAVRVPHDAVDPSQFGILFQFPLFIAELSVVENVMLSGMIVGLSIAEARKQALWWLAQVGLSFQADSSIETLSGGQKQRVALARALYNKPAFLLADEPTGNLDQGTAQEIIDLLLFCQKEWGMGIILSTHDYSVAHRMEHQLALKAGKLQSVTIPAHISILNTDIRYD